MENYIEQKVIVVTGAASGFGQLICEKTSRLGARVVASDVNQADMEKVVADINAGGGTAIAVTADVTDRLQMRSLATKAIEAYGRIDVMVNNAGIMPLAFFADHHDAADRWDKCIDINIKGVLNGITAVYDQMIEQGQGHVVNISSIYGNFPVAGGGVYGATKAAVAFLSECLRVESQGKIKVTTIRPTGVPATNLSGGIVNANAVAGIFGGNAADVFAKFEAAAAGELPEAATDRERIEYANLDAASLADQIVYAINQPLGVSISDITIRASGDGYVI